MTFVGNTAFHTFRNQFLRTGLEITVFTSVFHCCDRSHTTVYFVFSSLIQFEASRAFITSGKHAAHHTHVSSGCDCFCHISGILDTAICDDRHTVFFCCVVAIHNCCDLWNTDSGNHTGRTDRSRSDTYFYRIGSGLDQVSGCCTCCNVTCDHLQIRIFIFDHTQCFENICGMSVCRVDNNDINFCFYQSIHTFHHVCCDSNSCTTKQTTVFVFCRLRIFDLFFNIFDGDQTFQVEVIIYDRQFFFSCLCKDLFGFIQCDTFFCCDQSFGCHTVFDLLGEILFEFQVTVCDDTNQFSAFCNRHTGDSEFCHQIVGIFQCVFR